MALQSSVQFLASQLMGLGDRSRQDKQLAIGEMDKEKQFGMQQRYLKLAQAKEDEAMRQAKANQAQFQFGDLVKSKAIANLNAAKIPITDASIQQAMPDAAKQVFRENESANTQGLGRRYAEQYGSGPSRQPYQIPNRITPTDANMVAPPTGGSSIGDYLVTGAPGLVYDYFKNRKKAQMGLGQ